MNTMNGWKEVERGSRSGVHGSKYDKYRSLLVVVLSDSKTGHLYLMQPVLEVLKESPFIKVMSRGSNLALVGDAEEGYKIQKWHGDKHKKIQIKKIVQNFRLKPGAYQCHIENDYMVVFDSSDTPSIP